jgi:4'-phosphopantetheinyl transferase
MLRTSENGKLSVFGDVLFNVAHSKGLAVFAFTHNLEVGVDIELIRPLADLGGMVELTLAPSEAADLQSVPAEDRAAAFFACWTRKEAYLKASGNGLGSPRDVAVTLRPRAPERLVSVQGAPAEPERWELASFEPRPGYVGAVAVERAA